MAAAHDESLTLTQAVLITVEISQYHWVPIQNWKMVIGAMRIRAGDTDELMKIKKATLKILKTLIKWMEISSGQTMEKLIAIFEDLHFNALARNLKKQTEWIFPVSNDTERLGEYAALPITDIICKHPVVLDQWCLLLFCLELKYPNECELMNGKQHEIVLNAITTWITSGHGQRCPSLGNLTAIFRLLSWNTLADKLERIPDE